MNHQLKCHECDSPSDKRLYFSLHGREAPLQRDEAFYLHVGWRALFTMRRHFGDI